MGAASREVVLLDVSGLAQVHVIVPSLLKLDFGASIDVAYRLADGAFVGLPTGARVTMQAGRFEWHVAEARDLPVTLVFVIGARRICLELSTESTPHFALGTPHPAPRTSH